MDENDGQPASVGRPKLHDMKPGAFNIDEAALGRMVSLEHIHARLRDQSQHCQHDHHSHHNHERSPENCSHEEKYGGSINRFRVKGNPARMETGIVNMN